MYGGDNNSFTIDTINTATGAATIGPKFVEPDFGNIFGLAPEGSGPQATPEPASILEMVLGLGGLAGWLAAMAQQEKRVRLINTNGFIAGGSAVHAAASQAKSIGLCSI